MKQPKETQPVGLIRTTTLGTRVRKLFPSNSGAAQRHEIKSRDHVVHNGGTRIGSFRDDK